MNKRNKIAKTRLHLKLVACSCAALFVSGGTVAGITELTINSLKSTAPSIPVVPTESKILIRDALGASDGDTDADPYDLTEEMGISFSANRWDSANDATRIRLLRSSLNIFETKESNDEWFANETTFTNISETNDDGCATAFVQPIAWSSHYTPYDQNVSGSGFYVVFDISSANLRDISSDVNVTSMGLDATITNNAFGVVLADLDAQTFIQSVATWSISGGDSNDEFDINQIVPVTDTLLHAAVWEPMYVDESDGPTSAYDDDDSGAYKLTLTAATDSNVYIPGSQVVVHFRCLRGDITFNNTYPETFPVMPSGIEWTSNLFIYNGKGDMNAFDALFTGTTLELVYDSDHEFKIKINGSATIEHGLIDGGNAKHINFVDKVNLVDTAHFGSTDPTYPLEFTESPTLSDIWLYLRNDATHYGNTSDISSSFFQITNIDADTSAMTGTCHLEFITQEENDFYTAFGQSGTPAVDDYSIYITINFTFTM